MYTINNFIFGVDITGDGTPFTEDEIIILAENAIFEELCSNLLFGEYYHGGWPTIVVRMGIELIDDDKSKKDFVKTVRSAKREDYLSTYLANLSDVQDRLKNMITELSSSSAEFNIFAPSFIEHLKSFKPEYREEVISVVNKLLTYITDTEPDFYILESSS